MKNLIPQNYDLLLFRKFVFRYYVIMFSTYTITISYYIHCSHHCNVPKHTQMTGDRNFRTMQKLFNK